MVEGRYIPCTIPYLGVMYRLGDVFTSTSIYGDYYFKCTLLKDVGGYRHGTLFECVLFDTRKLELCFSMDGGGFDMTKQLTTID